MCHRRRRTPNLAAANAAQLLLGAAWIPTRFVLNLSLQQALGHDAFESGAALLPTTITILLLMATLAPHVIARYGPTTPILTGTLRLATGTIALSLVRANDSFIVDVLPTSLTAAAGIALAFIPSLSTANSSATPQHGGLASGIANTSYQLGSALGLAAITAIATNHDPDRHDNPAAQTHGNSAASIGAAGSAFIGTALAAALLRFPNATAAATAEAQTPAPIAA